MNLSTHRLICTHTVGGLSIDNTGTDYVITDQRTVIPVSTVDKMLQIAESLTPYEFGLLIHLVTGHCMVSRDATEVLYTYARKTCTYCGHMEVLKNALLEAEKDGSQG